MTREGELVVRLGLKANRVHSVNIASSRVALPERMTRGRSADEVARTLPLLFSICARAQAAAAAGALDAARGRTTRCRDPAATCRRRSPRSHRRVADPSAHRLAARAGRRPGREQRGAGSPGTCRTGTHHVARHCTRAHLSGSPPNAGSPTRRWLHSKAGPRPRDPAGTPVSGNCNRSRRISAAATSARCPSRHCEALCAPCWRRLADDPNFSQSPDWLGCPVETGALARRRARTGGRLCRAGTATAVAARILAQLVDLAALLSRRR